MTVRGKMRQRLYELLHGDGDDAIQYGRIMTVVIVISLLPLCFKDSSAFLNAVEWVCVVVFLLDYAIRWATVDMGADKGIVSFVLYPFTPMAIIDLLSILPTFMAFNPAFRALRVLRLFRTLRAFRLIRYSSSVNMIVSVFSKQREPLLATLGFATAYVLVSALVMFNVEPETFENCFDAIYWAVVSLTTVGYGDLYPTTEIGRIIAMLSSLMGIAIVALPASIITAGFMDQLNNRENEQ